MQASFFLVAPLLFVTRHMALRIVFMGTPEFAVPSLEGLVEAGYTPIAVATTPDRPSGRGQRITESPVKKAALKVGIDRILQPESVKDPEFAREVEELRPDIIVVVAFKILPPSVYECARLGAFNLHGSLLPRYRGAAPIHHAVLAGDRKTGVTTFFLKKRVDTGEMIQQRELDIGPDETTGDVHDRMMHLGAGLVVETVRLIESGRVETIPQDDSQATPAPKVFRDDARIDWGEPAERVHNLIRGMSPVPGAFTVHDGVELKLLRSRVYGGDGPPGTVLEVDDRLVVACGVGTVEIVEVQQQGRRRLPAADFLRGSPLRTGDLLE
ncbi:MAG: methionyl-tRNA formyltransferase, partial [Rhodothermales bacterium]|nr:methionyl-tRNA formyltransferase [Rhodothermales bacterium]